MLPFPPQYWVIFHCLGALLFFYPLICQRTSWLLPSLDIYEQSCYNISVYIFVGIFSTWSKYQSSLLLALMVRLGKSCVCFFVCLFGVFFLWFWEKFSCNSSWTTTYCVIEDNTKVLILLPLPPKCWVKAHATTQITMFCFLRTHLPKWCTFPFPSAVSERPFHCLTSRGCVFYTWAIIIYISHWGMCVCVCVRAHVSICTCEHKCPSSPEEGTGSPAAEVRGRCEPPSMGPGNWNSGSL